MIQRTSRLLAAAVLAAALTSTAPAQAKPLKRGAHGARVVQLQRALHVHPADGAFGRGTVRAVKRFQRRHHIAPDGVVGAGTWSMVRRARHARRVRGHHVTARVRVMHRGPSVRLLQRRLGVGADGVFGAGTRRAVKRFQRGHGMHADGIVGPATWSALGVRGRHPVLKALRSAAARHGHRAGGGVARTIARAIAAGDRIARTPYVYGGGHASFNASGYDCSGSVSYVLHHAGLLRRPLDSGSLASYGAPGRGRYITIYANPGHVFMIIRGRRFDTSGTGPSGSRWSSTLRGTSGYTVRHPAGL